MSGNFATKWQCGQSGDKNSLKIIPICKISVFFKQFELFFKKGCKVVVFTIREKRELTNHAHLKEVSKRFENSSESIELFQVIEKREDGAYKAAVIEKLK